MKNSRLLKGVAITVVLTMCLLMISACGQSSAPPAAEKATKAPATDAAPAADAGKTDRKIKVGFSQVGAEHDWRTGHNISIRDSIINEGWELVYNDANLQQQNQIQALRDFITQGVDYIALAPIAMTGWDQVMIEVKESGIPLILVDRDIELDSMDKYDVVTAHVTNDSVAEGKEAGEWLVKYLEHIGRAGEDINIVELQGSVGSAPAIERARGFREYIAAYPNLQITQTQTAEWSVEQGLIVMEAFLGKAQADGTPIDVVFTHSDGMALGAIQATRDAGMNPGEDIIFIGIDGGKTAFESVVAGDLNVTIECTPLRGPKLVETIKHIEAGESFEKLVMTPIRIFDEALCKVYPDKYFSAAADLPNRIY